MLHNALRLLQRSDTVPPLLETLTAAIWLYGGGYGVAFRLPNGVAVHTGRAASLVGTNRPTYKKVTCVVSLVRRPRIPAKTAPTGSRRMGRVPCSRSKATVKMKKL